MSSIHFVSSRLWNQQGGVFRWVSEGISPRLATARGLAPVRDDDLLPPDAAWAPREHAGVRKRRGKIVTYWAFRVGVLGLSLFALAILAQTQSATTAIAATTRTTTSTTPTQTEKITQTKTVSKTTTATAHPQTKAVVKTQTVTTPTTTTTSTSHAAAAAAAGAAAAANKEPSSDSSGLPGWAWALIGAAVVGGAIWIITLIRRGRRDSSPSDGTGGPGASGGEPPLPNAPPRA